MDSTQPRESLRFRFAREYPATTRFENVGTAIEAPGYFTVVVRSCIPCEEEQHVILLSAAVACRRLELLMHMVVPFRGEPTLGTMTVTHA